MKKSRLVELFGGPKKIRAVKIPKRIQKDAHAVILIGGLALGKMCPDLARFIVANEHGIKSLVVVGEVCGSGFRRGRAVPGSVLAEIGDRQFRFARMIFQGIFQLRRAMHARNLRQRNLGRIWWRRRRDLGVPAAKTIIIPRKEFRMPGRI